MSSASTAILVKSRAKFGRRLTTKDYDELLSCRNILDITNFLKTNTHYGSVLENIRESAVHRGNLESLLKQKMYNDFARLCSFERSIGEHYFEYLLLRSEIDQLLLFLRYFTAGTPEKFIFNLPDFFKNSTITSNRFLILTYKYCSIYNSCFINFAMWKIFFNLWTNYFCIIF